jgi:predicted lactoylglutathione lyase
LIGALCSPNVLHPTQQEDMMIGFYAGYFRDPDGNKLNAFVMRGE